MMRVMLDSGAYAAWRSGIGISTPYRKVGLMYQKHRDHFGVDGDDVLVLQGPTRLFNPTISEATIAAQALADPTAAMSEWSAEFRIDLATYLEDALIEGAIEHARPQELPPQRGVYYKAFVDASGGVGNDSYTIAIGHKQDQNFIIDLVLLRHNFRRLPCADNEIGLTQQGHRDSVGDESDDQSPSDSCDGIRNVALRPQWRTLWADKFREL